jgi:hypothetical protein
MHIAADHRLARKIHQTIKRSYLRSTSSLDWLRANFHPYVFIDLQNELEAVSALSTWLHTLTQNRRMVLALWLYQQSNLHGGIYLDVEVTEDTERQREYRVMFAAGNPPQIDFLQQIMEVFNRLGVGVKRAYCLTISNGLHPYFLGTFYVRTRDAGIMDKNSELFTRLRKELYNTQILSTASHAYREFVTGRVMSGEEASLVNAFIAFCHTNLAHNQPDRFGYEDVTRAFPRPSRHGAASDLAFHHPLRPGK